MKNMKISKHSYSYEDNDYIAKAITEKYGFTENVKVRDVSVIDDYRGMKTLSATIDGMPCLLEWNIWPDKLNNGYILIGEDSKINLALYKDKARNVIKELYSLVNR